jgi:hypothetical protein
MNYVKELVPLGSQLNVFKTGMKKDQLINEIIVAQTKG